MPAVDFAAEAELFDYDAEAELFPARNRKFRHRGSGYRRFARAGDAIRFAIEQMPRELLVGAYLEVNEARYSGDQIRRLYDSVQYPLARRAAG
jgi:hypothetical protein